MKLKTSAIERGKGFWKMNVKVIESKLFDTTFRTFWKTWVEKINDFDTKKDWWEYTKVKIKLLCIEVSMAKILISLFTS